MIKFKWAVARARGRARRRSLFQVGQTAWWLQASREASPAKKPQGERGPPAAQGVHKARAWDSSGAGRLFGGTIANAHSDLLWAVAVCSTVGPCRRAPHASAFISVRYKTRLWSRRDPAGVSPHTALVRGGTAPPLSRRGNYSSHQAPRHKARC